MIKFELSDKQIKELDAWRDKIRDLHGNVGREEFIFSPTGIGYTCMVKNISYGIELDLDDSEDW